MIPRIDIQVCIAAVRRSIESLKMVVEDKTRTQEDRDNCKDTAAKFSILLEKLKNKDTLATEDYINLGISLTTISSIMYQEAAKMQATAEKTDQYAQDVYGYLKYLAKTEKTSSETIDNTPNS